MDIKEEGSSKVVASKLAKVNLVKPEAETHTHTRARHMALITRSVAGPEIKACQQTDHMTIT